LKKKSLKFLGLSGDCEDTHLIRSQHIHGARYRATQLNVFLIDFLD